MLFSPAAAERPPPEKQTPPGGFYRMVFALS
jgi:hypothetical protein